MIHREEKIAPKDIRCSGCPTIILKGQKYYKHGYGRYCPKCSNGMKELKYSIGG